MSFLSEASFVRLAANIASALFAIVIVIQLLLAAGILPITMAWGGRQSELTPALRVASVAAALLLGVFIYIIRYRAGLLGDVPSSPGLRAAAWVVTGFMALNTLGNLASVSRTEKFVFGPIALLTTVACFSVAASNVN